MLEFLKKIFQNDELENKGVSEIKLQELENWLNEKSKPLLEGIQIKIEGILMRVNEEIQRSRFNIEVLENAKLQNPNIPFKAKQYMEGNRKAYIRSVNSFLGHLEINNKDYFYLTDFCKLFDGLIDDLNKGTLRSYTILQEFFANEAAKIAQNLRNFDILFKELKSVLNDEKIVAVNGTIEEAQNLKSMIRQKINIHVEFMGMEAELKLATNEKESTMDYIERFNKSEEHTNFLNLNEQKKKLANDFYNDENTILQSFSVLERPLRKYSHVAFEHEEIVLDYLKNPIETLTNDKSFTILVVLKNLENLLNENQIMVDERRKEKSLEEIKKFSREFIEQFLKKYYSYKSEIDKIEGKIISSGVTEKFKNLNHKLEGINYKIEKDSKELESLKNEFDKLTNSVESLKNQVENSVKNIFGEGIRVIV